MQRRSIVILCPTLMKLNDGMDCEVRKNITSGKKALRGYVKGVFTGFDKAGKGFLE